MAQDTTPALVLYAGQLVNGDWQTNFEVPFDKGAYGEIKVAFVRRGLTDYTYDPDTYTVSGYLYAWNGGVYTKTETVDTDTPLYDKYGVATGDTWTMGMYREPKNDIFSRAVVEWTGDPITDEDVICIVRDTVKDQPYTYPNNQKHIERALDNLSRQIQELQLTADNALKVDPSWNYTLEDPNKMDPVTWLQTIVRSKGQTLRELRVDNGYIAYTADDPDSATKTWNVLAGVKTGNAGVVSHIRETQVLAEDGVTYIPYLEYSVDGGNTWRPAGQGQSELEHLYVKKTGDTMTGALTIEREQQSQLIAEQGLVFNIKYQGNTQTIFKLLSTMNGPWFHAKDIILGNGSSSGSQIIPASINDTLGIWSNKWKTLFVQNINNGYNIAVPVTNRADTLALKSQVDLAANSGRMITAQGFWYAKMYAATTPATPTYGTNYVDFSQVDGNNNPIIVPFEATGSASATQTTGSSLSDITVATATFETQITTPGSYAFDYDGVDWYYDGNPIALADYGIAFTGTPVQDDVITVIYAISWTQGTTITPPADYDGYIPITSKIWDIQEQDGQQGGRILWNHTSKEFTPYPTIVSFDGANITNSTISGSTIINTTFSGTITSSTFSGTISGSTIDHCTLTDTIAPMPTTPVNNTVANVGYVKESQNKQAISDLTADTATVVLSKDKTIYRMSVTGNLAITIDSSAVAEEGYAQTFELHLTCGASLPTITWAGIDRWVINSDTSPIEVNATSIFAIRVQMGENESTPTVVANYGGAY